MAFLFDPNDPKGLGMFSKIGRISSQKILFFKQTEAFKSVQLNFNKNDSNEKKKNLKMKPKEA